MMFGLGVLRSQAAFLIGAGAVCLLAAASAPGQQQAPAIFKAAHAQAEDILLREVNRLKALQQVNPNVRDTEIDFFDQQLQALTRLIDATRLRLDALRVIVAM